ncbi:MAG: twitch domain-containing radical SAM protein [Reichenbachiella sp.]
MKALIPHELNKNKAFCLMPWLHLYVNTRGLCQACCISPITFGDVNKQSIDEIWKGDKIQNFRKKLLEGKKDKRCNSCYTLEDSGVKSIRQETLEKFGNKIETVLEHGSRDVGLPIYLDIRFSNVCNFRCVTCWHGASSKWFEEAKAKNTHVANTAIIKAIDDENDFFRQIEQFISGVEEFYFAGGEPLVMDEHYKVLDLLLKQGKTDVHLRYNTNLSLLTFKGKSVLDYWKKFNKVTVSASLDAAGDLGERIRRDSNWGEIKKNLRSIKKNCSHIKLEIAPTISTLNVLAFPELHKGLVEEGLIEIDAVYINMLFRPHHYNIKNVEEINQVRSSLKKHIGWLGQQGANQITVGKVEEILGCLETSN